MIKNYIAWPIKKMYFVFIYWCFTKMLSFSVWFYLQNIILHVDNVPIFELVWNSKCIKECKCLPINCILILVLLLYLLFLYTLSESVKESFQSLYFYKIYLFNWKILNIKITKKKWKPLLTTISIIYTYLRFKNIYICIWTHFKCIFYNTIG